jgi:hypothetical protein
MISRYTPFETPRWRESEGQRRVLAAFERVLPLHKPSDLARREIVQFVLSATRGREWIDPTVDICGVHQKLLETVPASMFRVSKHFDAAHRAISRYCVRRLLRIPVGGASKISGRH